MWTWIKALLTRYALLENRVTVAEQRINEELSHSSVRKCLQCGVRKFFVSKTTEIRSKNYEGASHRQNYERTYTCKECGFSETYLESGHYPDIPKK